MLKKISLCLALAALTFSLAGTSLMAQGNTMPARGKQQQRQSPFLITNGLPHLTKLLMRQWENPTLNLTEEQKTQLLVVRTETIGAVHNLKPQLGLLQQQVREGVFMGKTPAELHAAVQAISKLKAEATMIQLKCIYDTNRILTLQQLDLLLN